MIGITEILVILVAIGLVALFGRKTIKKFMKDGLALKKDYKDAQKEIEGK